MLVITKGTLHLLQMGPCTRYLALQKGLDVCHCKKDLVFVITKGTYHLLLQRGSGTYYCKRDLALIIAKGI